MSARMIPESEYQALYEKYCSPEAAEHFKNKYPKYHPDDDLPQGDEPAYGDPDE